MLEKVKSFGNVKLIFSFLEETYKLNIIQLNKKLKNKFGYSLEFYKKISGKIKIAEKNGKGKEFKDEQLIFEGNYLNYKRNGLGKEFKDNKIIFEGNYLFGKRNGTGIEYDYIIDNKFIKFEGEYLHGKRNGQGKEYFIDKKIKFEGEFKKGKKLNGNGYDFSGKKVYEIKNGMGNIIEYNYKGEKIFEGEYLNGRRYGKEFRNNEIIFEGEYKDDQKDGKGKEFNDKKVIFDGEYLKGKKFKGKEYIL